VTLSRAWLIPVAGAVLAPLVTWFPMLAMRLPFLGLPPYEPASGIDAWGAQVAWLVALGLIAMLIVSEDAWLAAAVGLAGLTIFYRGAMLDPTHSVLFAAGALALWALRQTPGSVRPTLLSVLAGLGVFQALYVWQQQFLQYDILWGPLVGGIPNKIILPLGTLGTVDAASAYIAITAPLMPRWALPFAIVSVWISQSMGANAALVVGLGAKYLLARATWPRPVVIVSAVGGLAGAAWYFLTHVKTLDAVWPRISVWAFGLWDAAHVAPVFGYGLGGWAHRIPALQYQMKNSPTGELWREAHSEWIQLACEMGLVGVALLAGWLWTHRTMFAHPVLGPSLAALAVSCASFFTFHVVATALVGVVLIGLAMADETPLPALGGA
jgi:hypothetical protein